jgi:hypothetical protein
MGADELVEASEEIDRMRIEVPLSPAQVSMIDAATASGWRNRKTNFPSGNIRTSSSATRRYRGVLSTKCCFPGAASS